MDYEVFATNEIDKHYFFARTMDDARMLFAAVKASGMFTYVSLYSIVRYEKGIEDWGMEEEEIEALNRRANND